ncbi:MAG TPA: S8 family peptidase [Vicinamibacterales bacterium]|nr:S8 family peptidase [Vicinamibacterales bacterium]
MARRLASFVLLLILILAMPLVAFAGSAGADAKLDALLRARAAAPRGLSRVIIRSTRGGSAAAALKKAGGIAGRRLAAVDGQVALLPDVALLELAASPDILSIALDRRVHGAMERTSAAIGASWVRDELGFDGSGVGVAIIDSGVANWHDDLGSERVTHFADFITYLPSAHDEYGHGTHVAGIIAGSGFDSGGARRGVAPGASLIVLKVLDGAGDGYISNVIAAIDYAIEQRARFNIRVLNLSVSAGVFESYATDPFTLAAKRAVDAGIVVVTAAGNLGRNDRGQVQHGGITAPGNAPWVLTVGASHHHRTVSRADDTLAAFTSRGPTNIDRESKPDLVAPGVGIESLAAAGSTIYNTASAARLRGTIDTPTSPYLALTGSSMSAPVVAGTVALMLQANPSLTPNLVKAILQYTAERSARYESSAQGAGFLNARGAVQLAGTLRNGASISTGGRDPSPWSREIIWGGHRVRGGVLTAGATAWRPEVVWGASTTAEGDDIVWGTSLDGETEWRGGGEAELSALDTPVHVAGWASFVLAGIAPDDRRRLRSAPLMEARGF